MTYIFRPFEVLKLIRDRVITNMNFISELSRVSTISGLGFINLIEGFRSLGWIKLTEDGTITPTERILDVQKACHFSLTDLSPYNADSVICTPLFGRPSQPPTPADVFVLMPFVSELQAVYDDHIKAVTTRLGLTVTRADNFFAAHSIISDVWNAINQARILIADCTRRNPNVFYELGIAHTIGKPVILIAQSVDDIPFDIRHMRTIFYAFTPRGMRDFESALEATLKGELAEPQTLSALLAMLRENNGSK